MNEVLHSRIRTTESGLEGLKLTQQQLITQLHVTKTAIMNEMMMELEARFVTKDQIETGFPTHKVRPGASVFVPSLCPSTGYGGEAAIPAGGGAQLQKPPPFDGCSPWDAYKLQFEMLSTVNG